MRQLFMVMALVVYWIIIPNLAHEADSPLVNLNYTQYAESQVKLTPPNRANEEHCLTEAVYYESGNQSVLGKEAVALVVVNRVGTSRARRSVCAVVQESYPVQGTEDSHVVCQFSYRCEERRAPMKEMWKESRTVAQRVMSGYVHRELDMASGILYFHTTAVHPSWSKTKEKVMQIEEHIFYREPL